MSGEVGKLLRGELPVADPFIPAGDGFGRDALHRVETPAVVDNQHTETELDGTGGIRFDPLLRDLRVNRVPGAEHRVPCSIGKLRLRQFERVAPGRQCFGPREGTTIKHQPEISGIFGKRQFAANIVGTTFLIHFGNDPAIVGQIGDTA